MNVGYVHTFEVPENNIDKGRLKVSVVNEENVPIKGAGLPNRQNSEIEPAPARLITTSAAL